MKKNSLMLCLGAGLFAWIASAGCAQTPVRQIAEKLPDPKPVVEEKPASPVTAEARSDKVPVSTTEPDSIASIISKPETPKSAPVANLPVKQPTSSSNRDSLPFSTPKVEPPKPASAPLVCLAVATDKKPNLPKPAEKKFAAVEPSIKQAKLELPMPAPRAVDSFPKTKPAPLPSIVAKPAPKKPTPPIEFVEDLSAKKATPLPTIKTKTGRADDYTWLCGQLQYWPLHKSWRLRYAGLDEVDPYGGSVTLADGVRGADAKDGQYVRVEGRLIDPAVKSIAPAYAVESIHALDK